jgi:pyruvate-formate lyase-activating enzyme
MQNAGYLPLFSYGAVGWQRGEFRSAVVRVDAEPRQDLRQMQRKDVAAGVKKLRRQLPQNRLRAHLEKCALEYGCPAAKNFFLGRYEAPLPSARQCNARCIGCLSLQPNDEIPCSQDRIGFTPSPEEIAEVALAHIGRVKHGIVSFGQGCEGDPLLAADVITPAIRRIRKQTDRGTINMNSNGSLPQTVQQLFDAGLDSIRVSLNSVRPDCYAAYFRPQGYDFSAVLNSIEIALKRKKFVSLNYLNCPGITDSPQETAALTRFLHNYPINMIQWRNLNFDPLRYWKTMNAVARHGEPVGVRNLISQVRAQFPKLKHGYFNPPKEKFN